MADQPGDALRLRVAQRALRSCEYCRLHEDDSGYGLQTDHILSRKHGGKTTYGNLAYCCATCNRYKGTDIASLDPETGELVRLFHPRTDRWDDHFEIDGPSIRAKSPIGAVTARILRLNAGERLEERRILQSLKRYPTA